MVAYVTLVVAVAAERLFELVLSHRNAARSFARGGLEVGRGHFGIMRLMHTAFLVACVLEVVLLHRTFVAWLGAPMLVLALAAQALRYWAIITLGDRWNVRVIVVPGEPAIRRGPYRWLRHPNYLAVVVELIALPLIHGAWLTALVFTCANALLLRVRIACENEALDTYAVAR